MIEIVRMFWKRTYLFVEYRSENQVQLYLRSMKGKKIIFHQKQLEKNIFRAKLNVCIAEGREMLGEGEWVLCSDEAPFLSKNVMQNLEVLSQVFRYDKDKAYIVTFHLEEEKDGRLSIQLKVDYMMKNPHPKRRVDKLLLVKMVLNIWYQVIYRLYPKKENRILFLAENRDELSGNLKALYDRLYQRGLDQQYVVHKSVRNIFTKKQSVLEWLSVVTKIACHDYIFVEDYVPALGFLNINKKTVIVQTWHAGFGFKSVGYGRFGLAGSPNPFHSCHRTYTYGLVGNEHLKEIYSEVFGIEEDALLATGMPRLSYFLDEKTIEETRNNLYQSMPFLQGKRVITFAPTYRGSNQKEAYYDLNQIDQKELYEFCEENNAVVLFKFHPFLKYKIKLDDQYKKNLIDLSEYNINDLFYITDILITDYSSCFYDYILLKKPVLFFAYDEEEYSATRGIHRPVSKVAPGPVCKSFHELMQELKKTDYKDVDIPKFMIDNCIKRDKMTASDKVIDYIILGKKDIVL